MDSDGYGKGRGFQAGSMPKGLYDYIKSHENCTQAELYTLYPNTAQDSIRGMLSYLKSRGLVRKNYNKGTWKALKVAV